MIGNDAQLILLMFGNYLFSSVTWCMGRKGACRADLACGGGILFEVSRDVELRIVKIQGDLLTRDLINCMSTLCV